ncbi:MAG: Hpt domain-containing protein [Acidobacteria bacterium]|nr:Hpt domain-containing protein [Acidobacteriota bacterium]
MKVRFIGGLARRMDDIDRLWASPGEEATAARALHSLAGTASTFRLAFIAEAAGEAEIAIEDGIARPTIDKLLARLRETVTACP